MGGGVGKGAPVPKPIFKGTAEGLLLNTGHTPAHPPHVISALRVSSRGTPPPLRTPCGASDMRILFSLTPGHECPRGGGVVVEVPPWCPASPFPPPATQHFHCRAPIHVGNPDCLPAVLA